MRELLMGNEAIALGALGAGVQLVAGYPGTPSTEVLETVAKRRPAHVYVEWSVNEKAAVEVAAGAAMAGARVLVTMKQVGLNAANDPIMCLNYVGVRGGMVVLVADDPGPISSQTEQDTRRFAQYGKFPVFDPESPEEAYRMVGEAFRVSETYQTPVILRPTTRVCHSCASIDVAPFPDVADAPGFLRDKSRWVIFPQLTYQSKLRMFEREKTLAAENARRAFNSVAGSGTLGVAAGGFPAALAEEAIAQLSAPVKLLKVKTPYPFPDELAASFLEDLTSVLVVEELDPLIEDALTLLCGRRGIRVDILGKRTGHTPAAGELNADSVRAAIASWAHIPVAPPAHPQTPPLPARPPVLCAGCPHRGSFYAVKRAMQGKKAVFSGDIGCYTLGNAQPLDMVDTCLCMGAGVTIAQGLSHAEKDATHFAFIGDSTFFHSGLTGVVNAVYNQADIVLIVLDNHTTAMTGHQPHPGIGRTMMGAVSEKIDIGQALAGLGVRSVRRANPFDLESAVQAVRDAQRETGVRAVLFEAPCIALRSANKPYRVDAARCVGCRKCIAALGCPALSVANGRAQIDESLCVGCDLCRQVCPRDCIGEVRAQ